MGFDTIEINLVILINTNKPKLTEDIAAAILNCLKTRLIMMRLKPNCFEVLFGCCSSCCCDKKNDSELQIMVGSKIQTLGQNKFLVQKN